MVPSIPDYIAPFAAVFYIRQFLRRCVESMCEDLIEVVPVRIIALGFMPDHTSRIMYSIFIYLP